MLRQALDTPWKIQNELWRRLTYPWVRIVFAINGIPWGQRWRFYGVPVIQKHRQSRMVFGPGLQLRSSVKSNPLGPNHPVFITTWQANAVLEVGENFGMTGGTICAASQITIGNNVDVGANSTIIDTDFHSLNPARRQLEPTGGLTSPITIEDNVFIGMSCLILKGVTLGQGCVIGAGSVVSKDIPPWVIAAGNPARVLRQLAATEIGQSFIETDPSPGYYPTVRA